MPLDSLGLFTQAERQEMEKKFDPVGLLRDEEKERLWGSPAYVVVDESGREVDVEKYSQERKKEFVPRMAKYLMGGIEGTVPAGVRKLIVEEIPKAMYQPGYLEKHPGVGLDIALMPLLGPGAPKGALGIRQAGGKGIEKGLEKEAMTPPPVAPVIDKGALESGLAGEALDVPSQVGGKLAQLSGGAGGRSAKDGLKSLVAELAPLSPETVVKMDKSGASEKIYRLFDQTSVEENKFLVREMNEFTKASGKIKANSEGSRRVGRVLDGKLPVEQLTPDETRLYEFLKGKFDWLYNKHAQALADTPEGYKKVAYAASKEYKPQVKIVELDAKSRAAYDVLEKLRKNVLGGSKIAELDDAGKMRYKQIVGAQKKLRENAWVDRLSPGDKAAYVHLRKKVKDYLTHIFDRDEMARVFKEEISRLEEKLRLTSDPKEKVKLQNRLRTLHESTQAMEGGGIVRYKDLPQNFRFRFFETRMGREGYSFDAVKAYETYLHGFSRKYHGDPALKQAGELFKQVDPALKPYMRWFIENWGGIGGRSWADKIAGGITSWQWMTKLGMNPRSALTNFTQRLNTIAEVGEKWAFKGYVKGFTDEGKRLFADSGVGQEVPSVLMEGVVPGSMERLRQVLGWMFTKVELGNRKHAFLSGYEKAIAEGATKQQAMQKGIELVHKTQFRYGKVGVPKPLSGPVGRVAFQFWSYPIKQMEFMVKLWKENPLKLAKLLAYAEGGSYALDEFAGIDLSNALGFGMNYGELLKMGQSVKEGDIRAAYRHMKLGVGTGGLLPTTFGPTLDTLMKVSEAMDRGKGVEVLMRELGPVQGKKMVDAWKALQRGRDGKYPIISQGGSRIEELTGGELAMETFGPKVSKLSKEWEESSAWRESGKEYDQIIEEIVRKVVDGKVDEAGKLMQKYGVVPGDARLEKAYERWLIPARLRRLDEKGERSDWIRMNK